MSEPEQALAAHRRHPQLFGGCVRAIRALANAGRSDEARHVAHDYAAAQGRGTVEGDALLALVLAAGRRQFKPGREIVGEGDAGDVLYVLVEGRARARREGVGPLGDLPAGTVVGEIAPLERVARTATVWAVEPTTAVTFTVSMLKTLSEYLPGVHEHLRAMSRSRMLRQLMGGETVFGTLSEEQRRALYAECLPATLPEGTRIIRQGHAGTAVCIIASGTAEVWKRANGGERRTLAKLGPGDVFGELAILFDTVASATVETLTPLTVFALSRQRFDDALARHPDARQRVRALARERLEAHTLDGGDVALPVVRIVRTPPPDIR